MKLIRFRPAFVASLALLLAGPWAGAAAAAETVPAEVPIISMDDAVKKELLALDQMLATNPQLETTLRNNVDRLTEETFRAKNPEVDMLLKKRPNLPRALKSEPQFLITRSLARNVRSPMLRKDIVALDKFLQQNPDVRSALHKKPVQLVASDFLVAHPKLAKFMEEHPSLSSLLLQRAEKAAEKKASRTGEKK